MAYMQEFGGADEIDIAIVHAVERAPRASWAALASAVGVDPVTAARRWRRLETAGAAWVTCYPLLVSGQVSAIIQLRCSTGRVNEVTSAIARDPEAQYIEVTTGFSDVLVTAAAKDRHALTDYVLDRLGSVSGVKSVTMSLVSSVLFEGGYVAHGTISARGVALLPERTRGRLRRSASRSADRIDELDRAIWNALRYDGRRSFGEIARLTGCGESTVRRRMRQLFADGVLRMVVGVATDLTPASTAVWLSLRVPPKDLGKVFEYLATVPGMTAVVSVAGADNLYIKASFVNLVALGDFEAALSARFVDIHISDRKVVLRPVRSMARLLDERGFVTQRVVGELDREALLVRA